MLIKVTRSWKTGHSGGQATQRECLGGLRMKLNKAECSFTILLAFSCAAFRENKTTFCLFSADNLHGKVSTTRSDGHSLFKRLLRSMGRTVCWVLQVAAGYSSSTLGVSMVKESTRLTKELPSHVRLGSGATNQCQHLCVEKQWSLNNGGVTGSGKSTSNM